MNVVGSVVRMQLQHCNEDAGQQQLYSHVYYAWLVF